MTYQLEVLNPVASSQGDVHQVEPARASPSLAGKRIGLLWNLKRGGDVALRRAGALLKERFPDCQIVFYTGHQPTPVPIMEAVKRECDVVLASTAD